MPLAVAGLKAVATGCRGSPSARGPRRATAPRRLPIGARFSGSHDADARGDGTASEVACTCTGRPIRAVFPAVSRLHLHWPDRPPELRRLEEPHVIAAHDHAILFEAIVPLEDPTTCNHTYAFPVDLFVYSAFSSPPSLHRLPACFTSGVSTPDEDIYFSPYQRRQQRPMLEDEMGILCHGGGGGEFTVVDFTNFGPDGELCLLHHKNNNTETPDWMIKKVGFPNPKVGPSFHYWVTDAVVPLHGRFLCWVDCYQGILVLDVRNKVLKSSARYMNEEEEEGCSAKRVRRNVFDGHSFIPSQISTYLS